MLNVRRAGITVLSFYHYLDGCPGTSKPEGFTRAAGRVGKMHLVGVGFDHFDHSRLLFSFPQLAKDVIRAC